MACTSCSTSDGGSPKGCKNNGTCGTDSCNKLTVFDWLSNELTYWTSAFWLCWSSFQNGRKEFYRNTEKLTEYGRHCMSLLLDMILNCYFNWGGENQMKKKRANPDSNEVPKIYRKASQKDIDIWSAARERRANESSCTWISHFTKLEMKISDIEFQGDGSKATFYYTANDWF
jgi:hypothetical protein